jgi:hypothetical protein
VNNCLRIRVQTRLYFKRVNESIESIFVKFCKVRWESQQILSHRIAIVRITCATVEATSYSKTQSIDIGYTMASAAVLPLPTSNAMVSWLFFLPCVNILWKAKRFDVDGFAKLCPHVFSIPWRSCSFQIHVLFRSNMSFLVSHLSKL